MRPRLLPALLAALLLGACGHSPDPRYYVLSVPEGGEAVHTRSGPAIGLAGVRLPDYLQTPFILRRLDGNRLQHSPLQRWAEPLPEAVPGRLASHLAQALPEARIQRSPWSQAGQPPLQLRVDIEQLDADRQSLHLAAHWQIHGRAQQTLLSRSARLRIPLPAAGAAGIVAAHDQALARLAELMAADLQALPTPAE